MSGLLSLVSQPPWAFVLAALLGLAVGSFLNVVIYRLPLMIARTAEHSDLSLAMPASHCPHCRHPLAWRDNIPLLAYALLRGRCRFCQRAISGRYPLVELLTALTTVAVVSLYGFDWMGIGGLLLSWTLIALAFIDLETGLLPDELTLGLLWVGLLFSLGDTHAGAEQAVIGAVAGYLSLWSLNCVFKIIAKKDGLGHGDMKLSAALGAWLGWHSLPALLMVASLAGLLVSLIALAAGRIRREQQIPFGPYLAIAGWLLFCLHKQLSAPPIGSFLLFD